MNTARRCLLLGAAVLALALPLKAGAQPATQTLNPPYLAGLPPVDRVTREIQGDNPTDTLARQAAVMSNLSQVIRRLQMAPGRRYLDFTPDEQKLIGNYQAASYQIGQSYAKSHSADEAKAFLQLQGRYEMNDAIFKQTFTLLSPALLAEFGRINAAANAYQQAHVDQQRRESEEARALAARAPAQGSSPFVRNDPGTLAVRRCLELGGGDLECIGKGITTGVMDMAGVNPDVLKGPTAAGLRIGGTYQANGGPGIAFNGESANLSACGKLVDQGRKISITKRGNQLLVEIFNEPKPLFVILGPDGRLAGPGAIDIRGQIIVGYERHWEELRRVSDNTVVAGSGRWVQVPIYGPKTERCNFSSLRATAPVQAEGSLIGQVVGIAGGQADPAASRSGTTEAPAGPRMAGQYSSAGLRIEFHPTAALIDCGEAHVLRPYAVENLADRIVVTINNAGVAVPLTLQADGALAGSGAIDVAGRVVTGTDANGATFAARNVRCAVGVLAAR